MERRREPVCENHCPHLLGANTDEHHRVASAPIRTPQILDTCGVEGSSVGHDANVEPGIIGIETSCARSMHAAAQTSDASGGWYLGSPGDRWATRAGVDRRSFPASDVHERSLGSDSLVGLWKHTETWAHRALDRSLLTGSAGHCGGDRENGKQANAPCAEVRDH